MLSILGKISRRHFEIILLFFSRKLALTFHANCLLRRICRKCQSQFSGFDISCKLSQFAGNVKANFLGKKRKILSVCPLLNFPESGKGLSKQTPNFMFGCV